MYPILLPKKNIDENSKKYRYIFDFLHFEQKNLNNNNNNTKNANFSSFNQKTIKRELSRRQCLI